MYKGRIEGDDEVEYDAAVVGTEECTVGDRMAVACFAYDGMAVLGEIGDSAAAAAELGNSRHFVSILRR